ncbi:MAG: tannase/feruloyl esterase family alpha/beta hydrolase [Burkholderiales bacterium]
MNLHRPIGSAGTDPRIRLYPGIRRWALYAAVSTAALLSACGGGSGGSDSAAPVSLSCDDSIKTSFKPDANTSVLLVKAFKKGDPLLLTGAATATTPLADNDVCVVKLLVGPGNPGPADVSSTSPGIGIEVWLPSAANWNNRIHVKGGGGWAGGVQTSLTALAGLKADTSGTPASAALIEGAVSASTDTGHANTANGGSFAMTPSGTVNTALWNDFAQRGIHEMAVKTKALTKAYYGRDAKYAYWNGFSTGGRQGHMEAQANPNDFDGILAGAPAFNWTKFITAELYPQVVVQRDLGGVAVTTAQHSLVSNAAINACDVVNGQHLGYIPDPMQCKYDPTTDASVICAANGGTNATAACITPLQATAFNKFWYGQTVDGTVPTPAADNGTGINLAANQRWYGLTRGTNLAALAGPTPFPISSDMAALELQNPTIATPSFINATGNGADGWKALTYAQLSSAADRGIALQSSFGNINTDNPDLSLFRDRGAKMLMYHGLADVLIPPQGSINYYNRVATQMGGVASVQNFYRFYLVPGMTHGFSNGTPNPTANPPLPNIAQMYALLTDWVEKGTAPGRVDITTAVTTANPVQKSRPICLYPQKANYVSGDVNQASSYTCS